MLRTGILFLILLLLLINYNSPANTQINTIEVMLESVVDSYNGQNELSLKFEEITGYKLKIIQYPPANYPEHLIEKTISNDLPDIIEIPRSFLFNNSSYYQLAAKGNIIPLDQYLQYSKVLIDIDRRHLEVLKVNGKVYGIPIHKGIGYLTYIRKDWLDNLGMEIPATWEDLFEVMKAFTFKDPDRNGLNDTYGYSLPGFRKSTVNLADFYQGATDDFVFVDGKWLDGFNQQNFRKALERLKFAYQEKVLDPSSFLNEISTCRDKFYRGEVGIISFRADANAKRLEENCKINSYSKAKVIALPCIKASNYWNESSSLLAITSSTKNPEIAFKKFIEFVYDGYQGEILFTHGVEGIHYKIDNGEFIKLSSMTNRKEMFSHILIPPELTLNQWNNPIPLDERIITTRKVFEDNYKNIAIKPLSETYLKYGDPIASLKEEIMTKIIKSQYTIDEGIKIYNERVKVFGVDQIIKEFNCYK